MRDLYLDVNYYTAEYTNPGAGYLVGDPNEIYYNEDETINKEETYNHGQLIETKEY